MFQKNLYVLRSHYLTTGDLSPKLSLDW